MYIQRALALASLTILIGVTTGCDDDAAPTSAMPDAMIDMPDMTVMPQPDPTVTDVAIRPESPTAGDALECTWTFADEAGGEDASTVTWTINDTPAGTTPTLSEGYQRGDEVRCEVLPVSDSRTGTAVSATVTIANSPPSATEAAITPTQTTALTPLRCTYTFTDLDGDEQAETYAWTINDAPAGEEDTLAGGYIGGDTVTCTITPTDGFDPGAPVTVSIVIGNSAPAIDAIELGPDDVGEEGVLTCTVDRIVDPDGEDVTIQYGWTVSGEAIELDADTLDGTHFDRGDVVTCNATPSDATGPGTLVTSNEVTISNSPPAAAAPTLGPEMAREGSILTCTPGALTDPDPADMPMGTISWQVNREPIDAEGDTLDGTHFDRGDEVVCLVTPTDDAAMGPAAPSNPVVIGNTSPIIGNARLDPAVPVAGDRVACLYDYDDADDDADSSEVTWALNGEPAGRGPLFEGEIVEGDVLTCTVTPSDGTDGGMAITAEGTVGNTLPTIGEVLIFPLRDAFTNEDLTCEAQGVEEPDRHQPVTAVYAWTVNDELIEGIDGDTLPAEQFVRGDRIVCAVTLSDPFGPGPQAESDPKVIVNSPPTLNSASITPRRVRPNDELTCSYGGFADADDDDDLSRFQWFVNDEPVDGQVDLLSGAFEAGDRVACEVTAHDGFEDGQVRRAEVTIDPFTVSDASIECLSPDLGAMLTVADGGDVEIRGQVSETFALTSLTVDGEDVAWNDDGTFAATVNAQWGQNVHEVVIRDALGNSNRTFCSYFAAARYAREGVQMANSVVVDIAASGVDDGGDAEPIRSLTDVLRLVLNSPDLVTLLDQEFTANNPLVPNRCRQEACLPLVGCACVYSFGAEYRSLSIGGPNTIALSLVNGGIRVQATFRNLRVGVHLLGTADTTGRVDVSNMFVDMTLRVRLVEGQPTVSLLRINDASVGDIETDFSGVIGFILDLIVNQLVPLIRGFFEDEASNLLASYLATEVVETIGGLLSNFSGVDIQAPVPGFGEGSDVVLDVSSAGLSYLSVNPARIKLGFSTSADTNQPPSDRPSAGIPLPRAGAVTDALEGRSMGGAIYTGMLNDVLHALWRGRVFEIGDPGALVPDIPDGLDVSIALLTPPAVRGVEREGQPPTLEFHLGPLVGDVAPGEEGAEPLRIRAVAIITIGTELAADGEQVIFSLDGDGLDIDQLYFTIDGLSEDVENQARLEDNFRALARQLARESLANALPTLPIPEFRIPADVPGVGNRDLGLRAPVFGLTESHMKLSGRIGE